MSFEMFSDLMLETFKIHLKYFQIYARKPFFMAFEIISNLY